MKINSLFAGRFALTGVALATMLLGSSNALALGLGRLAVQSGLGETLRAEIDVTSVTPEEESNLQVRIAAPEAYRAAGVDYNPVLPGTRAVLLKRADGRRVLRITSDRAVQEPFVDVILEISWSTGRLVREYTMLFDPPANRTSVAAAPTPDPVATSPFITAAPPAPAPAPRAERRAAAPRPPVSDAPPAEPRRPAPRAAATEAAAGQAVGPDEYKVRPGDSLSRIASRTQRQGVSLDQMLASLYQANPDAFLRNNMNRLKSGVVLKVPSAESAKAITTAEARQLIQAQSADFGAYRQKLAGTVPAAKTDGSARQASGKVQAEVVDRKGAAATPPDTLTLSKGSAAKASAPEVRLSKEREQKESKARMAELAKNVEDLKKLSSASAAASGRAGAPAASAPSKAASVPGIPVPAVIATAPPPAPVPAPAPVAAPAPAVEASAPVIASAPEIASAPVFVPAPAEPASVPAEPASAPPLAASEPASAPVAATPAAEESGSILDNSLALAAGGGLLAVLLGFGIYRFTKRAKKDSGETSFLESRLQPDSFFGASGGQRIDTRDAGGASSSMSYSLSQLDAIGDVDPVAEADVYLAYGRDLQAEEILKEAMRASPERLAIRTKLLEVYAKRRDTKGFELLATQLYGLTGGKGEDWEKAQEIGLQIEPDNPLYQPGGAPASGEGEARPSAEPLGASTMPQSVLPSPSEFGNSVGGVSTGSGVDLDLDLGQMDMAAPPASRLSEQTQPFQSQAPAPAPAMDMDFQLPELSPAAVAQSAAPAAPSPSPMEFDLSGISLDLDSPKDEVTMPVASKAGTDFGDIDLGESAADEADPIARKLELAEEFRQIGDMEGARDLLQEVVARASGSVKSRAQAMLNELG